MKLPRYGVTRGEIAEKTKIVRSDIDAVQSIPMKSVSAFTTQEIAITKVFAKKYWQELGLKSPFFRAWFGDWRINDSSQVQIVSTLGHTREAQRNDDTGWDINVSGKVSEETLKHESISSINAREYLLYINDIVKKAILLDTFSMGGKLKSVNSLMMHSMYALVDKGDGVEVIKLYVEEMNDPNKTDTAKRAYKLKDIVKVSAVSGGVQGKSLSSLANTAETTYTVSDLFKFVKKFDEEFKPKKMSAVASSRGLPLLMYHGTPAENGDFTVFDANKAVKKGGLGLRAMGKGNYFTSKKLTGHERYGSRVIEAYLNIKKPFVYYTGGDSLAKQFEMRMGVRTSRMNSDELQNTPKKRSEMMDWMSENMDAKPEKVFRKVAEIAD